MAATVNHHYVPQFYLRGFSDGIERQAKLFAFDSYTKKSFTTLVRNIGSRRNFNKIEVEGVDPNRIEDAMAGIEAKIAPHLKQVIDAAAFPSLEHFNSIMNLMTILSVRNPRRRETMEDFHKEVVDRIIDISVSSKEIYEAQTQKMLDEGVPINGNIRYEDAKRFHSDKKYEILIDQTHLIKLELQLVEPVLKPLSQRCWSFVRAPIGYPFITCDGPVVLSWNSKVQQPTAYSPGHGLKNTVVLFTLSPEIALIGRFEKVPKRIDFSRDQVTALNTAVAQHSHRQIYAKNDRFFVDLKSQLNVSGADLPRAFAGLA